LAAIHLKFLRAAVIYLIVGMCLGLGMGISGDHRLFPAHAHIGLLGWASFALYGLVYRSFPSAAASRLARWHFWLANAGAFLLVVGVAGINLGNEGFVPLAGSGAVISIVGALVFATILFRADGASRG
jgi:hypothetical protein